METLPGRLTETALTADPAQTYLLYLPRRPPAGSRRPLTVLVHGMSRNPELYVERFAGWAEATGRALLAPRFTGPYQRLGLDAGQRLDLRLLAMVDEAAARHRLAGERFQIFGYSAGGQFVHRFAYLHAARLERAAVGAPGTVTLADLAEPWPFGLGGLAERARQAPDLTALARVPALLIVGADDVAPGQLNLEPCWARFGTTRVARLRRLASSWQAAKLPHAVDVVPGVGHAMAPRLAMAVARFFTAESV